MLEQSLFPSIKTSRKHPQGPSRGVSLSGSSHIKLRSKINNWTPFRPLSKTIMEWRNSWVEWKRELREDLSHVGTLNAFLTFCL